MPRTTHRRNNQVSGTSVPKIMKMGWPYRDVYRFVIDTLLKTTNTTQES